MAFNKYSLSTKEYLKEGMNALLKTLKNINPECRKSEIKKFINSVIEYHKGKKKYDALTEEEKISLAVEEFQSFLRNEIEETKNLRFLLTTVKAKDESEEEKYNYYIKRFCILLNFEKKKQYFNDVFKDKISKLRFDPPLPDYKEAELIGRMLMNEYARLNNNLISYNYFLLFLNSYYKNKNTIKLSNFNSFKVNILMFLLDVDYEKNASTYENYSFLDIPISFIENHIKKDGSEDDLTVKAKSKNYAKILRDAASHGEFYPNDQRNNFMHGRYNIDDEKILNESSMIRIENSKGIPRIGINFRYGILYDFVMNNLSDDTKGNYDFLIKIVKSDSFEDAIIDCSLNDLDQMLVLMLNNIVQYNLEHHFKESIDEIDNLNLSMFSIFDENNNGNDITLNITNKEKLMDIKNAIGHGNIKWEDDKLVLVNSWQPSNSRDTRLPTNRKIICNRKQVIEFLLQKDLYDFAISNQVNNSFNNKIKG